MNDSTDSYAGIRRLFQKHVPEVASGAVELMSIARKTGDRVLVAVRSHDPAIHAVSACAGKWGVPPKSIERELGGEKLSIVLWSESPARFIRTPLPLSVRPQPEHRRSCSTSERALPELKSPLRRSRIFLSRAVRVLILLRDWSVVIFVSSRMKKVEMPTTQAKQAAAMHFDFTGDGSQIAATAVASALPAAVAHHIAGHLRT